MFRLTRRIQAGPSWPPLPEAAPLSSAELAAILQSQFDEEDRMLAAERAELVADVQHVFDCGVCMDTLPEDSIARIDPCGHSFCRECVRSFVVSQIESRHFPVLCPTCTAERTNGTEETGSKPDRTRVIVSLIDLIHRRGDARSGTRHRNHGGALRDLG